MVEWIGWEKLGKLIRDSTVPNYEIGSDGSVEIHGITTTTLQAKDVVQDDNIDDL